MPIVAIDLSDEEAARVDTFADKEKRTRKAQCHIFLLEGLRLTEEKTTHDEPKKSAVK